MKDKQVNKILIFIFCINLYYWYGVLPNNHINTYVSQPPQIELINLCKIDVDLYLGNDEYGNSYRLTSDELDNYKMNLINNDCSYINK